MIKIFLLMISALVLTILSFFDGQEITIITDMPAKVRPGEPFTLRLTVSKGTLTGSGELQVTLPEGITAHAGDVQNSEFQLAAQSASFIWIKLPEEPVFTVSMTLYSTTGATGSRSFGGIFSYDEDQSTKAVIVNESSIVIDPEFSSFANAEPVVDRRLLAIAPENGEYRVELTIHHNLGTIPARFTDNLPEGCSATMVETHGAAFSTSGQSVTFKWDQIPADSLITISYAVITSVKTVAPLISGIFVYGDEAVPDGVSHPQSVLVDNNIGGKPELAEQDAVDTIINAFVGNEISKGQMQAGKDDKAESNPPAPQKGIYYKIQIAATQISPERNNQWFKEHYDITLPVDLTYHEGWKKYLIGKFSNYNEALAFKISTREKVAGAFIVAYENGKRVPVVDLNRATAFNWQHGMMSKNFYYDTP